MAEQYTLAEGRQTFSYDFSAAPNIKLQAALCLAARLVSKSAASRAAALF